MLGGAGGVNGAEREGDRWGTDRFEHTGDNFDFGQVANAFIRVVNQADGQELAPYDRSEDASTETAMIFGEVYRHGGEWKFRAVGPESAAGLRGIALDFGSMFRKVRYVAGEPRTKRWGSQCF